MRLLVITNDFPPAVGGIENYAFSLVKRWDPSRVGVLSRWMPGCEQFDAAAGFPIVREPVGTLLPTRALLQRAGALIRSEQFDAIHFPSALPLGLLGKALGVPYAVSIHGGEFILASRLPLARRALRTVCRNACVLLPESSFAEGLARRLIGPSKPLQRVTCGVDAERFPEVRGLSNRAEGDGRVVVSISRLIARKGQETLIRALPELIRVHPRTRLLIVGGGPHLARLRKLASRLRVLEAVDFAGPQPWEAIPRFLADADVFALPTRSRFAGTETEGLPLVVLEAAASALPIVAGNVGGIPDAVRHGDTGMLVEGSSHEQTGKAIADLLSDPALARQMGQRARQMVLDEFTWDRVAEKYRDALVRWCSR